MNHKYKGFLLFEFLITSLLASLLLIIVYQSYKTASIGVLYIRNNADFQTQKTLLLYQLELDAMHIIFPCFIYDLYPKIKNYFNKKKENNTEKEKKALENDFKLASSFFPELSTSPEEIKISWISSRKILNKNSLIKINYIFKPLDKSYKNKKLYYLCRREDPLESDYSVKKNGKEYRLINYIVNPEIQVLLPKINNEENESSKNNTEVMLEKKDMNNSEKKDTKEDDLFLTWAQKPLFNAEKELTQMSLHEMHKKAIIPYCMIIQGSMISYDLSKELDIQLTVNFPIADYALQMFFNNNDIYDSTQKKEVDSGKNNTNENKKEKNQNLLHQKINPVNQNNKDTFTPIPDNQFNNFTIM